MLGGVLPSALLWLRGETADASLWHTAAAYNMVDAIFSVTAICLLWIAVMYGNTRYVMQDLPVVSNSCLASSSYSSSSEAADSAEHEPGSQAAHHVHASASRATLLNITLEFLAPCVRLNLMCFRQTCSQLQQRSADTFCTLPLLFCCAVTGVPKKAARSSPPPTQVPGLNQMATK